MKMKRGLAVSIVQLFRTVRAGVSAVIIYK